MRHSFRNTALTLSVLAIAACTSKPPEDETDNIPGIVRLDNRSNPHIAAFSITNDETQQTGNITASCANYGLTLRIEVPEGNGQSHISSIVPDAKLALHRHVVPRGAKLTEQSIRIELQEDANAIPENELTFTSIPFKFGDFCNSDITPNRTNVLATLAGAMRSKEKPIPIL